MRAGYLVLGCGSIGQRHIRNLRSIGIDNVSAFDPDPARLANVVTQQGVIAHVDLNEALARKPAAVLVCTPPALHAAQALQALDNGSHVFMEKPIAEAMDRVEELLSRARRDRRILYVGYNLRFHAGLIKLKGLLDEGAIGRLMVVRAEVGQYLPDWRPDQDYRKGYNASSALGGGIILDASHELDYVRWLAGEVSTVACIADRLSDLEIDTEDTAAIMLRMASGAIAEIHLDCIQRSYSRNCKILGSRGTLQWDYGTGVRLFSVETRAWQEFPIVPDPNEMYVREMEHFVACVRGDATPLVDGLAGKRVLEIALAAKKAAAERCEVQL